MTLNEARAVLRRVYDQYAAIQKLHEALDVSAEADQQTDRLRMEQADLQKNIARLVLERDRQIAEIIAADDAATTTARAKLAELDQQLAATRQQFDRDMSAAKDKSEKAITESVRKEQEYKDILAGLLTQIAKAKDEYAHVSEAILELRRKVATV